ncbi:hypothetical protein BCONGLO52_09080 [Brachybacterium conglomeratum]|uniref:Uncharacterized protein n=1 Tax=Brachybacterium conglomeratum TaxID=47846 RepID=A0ABQ5RF55_9MICO|nr:hypothetical protein BCONGLO52_09080 [Brachybacterium conglomeratum]GLK04605.1 hypothetical protein GCM10017597_14050 [Brachybacterium conglomeratum]
MSLLSVGAPGAGVGDGADGGADLPLAYASAVTCATRQGSSALSKEARAPPHETGRPVTGSRASRHREPRPRRRPGLAPSAGL